jgi:hypothetical protein
MKIDFNNALKIIHDTAPKLSKEDIKSLNQTDRKILHSNINDRPPLSEKQKENIINLAEKLQNKTFSKYVEGKELKPSGQVEKFIKGIKQLVGGRIGSEEISSSIKKKVAHDKAHELVDYIKNLKIETEQDVDPAIRGWMEKYKALAKAHDIGINDETEHSIVNNMITEFSLPKRKDQLKVLLPHALFSLTKVLTEEDRRR